MPTPLFPMGASTTRLVVCVSVGCREQKREEEVEIRGPRRRVLVRTEGGDGEAKDRSKIASGGSWIASGIASEGK
jgi:hypothetical protein